MSKGEFEIDEAIRKKKVKDIKLANTSHRKLEQHHLVGKINSPLTVPICKPFHDVISSWQNSLPPKDRQNKLVMYLESRAGLLELLAKQDRELSFEIRRKKNEDLPKKLYESKNKV